MAPTTLRHTARIRGQVQSPRTSYKLGNRAIRGACYSTTRGSSRSGLSELSDMLIGMVLNNREAINLVCVLKVLFR